MTICVSYNYYCHIMEQKNEAAIIDYTVNDFQLNADEQHVLEFSEADQNLYFSKSHGKNVLSYRNKESVQTIYKRD